MENWKFLKVEIPLLYHRLFRECAKEQDTSMKALTKPLIEQYLLEKGKLEKEDCV